MSSRFSFDFVSLFAKSSLNSQQIVFINTSVYLFEIRLNNLFLDLAWTVPMYSGLIWYLRADDTSISANDWIPEGSCVASGLYAPYYVVIHPI